FWAIETRSLPLIVLATVVAVNVGNSGVYGPQPAYFSELFEPEVRYSGASIGAQAASVFAGGLAPVIATALFSATGGYHLIALYMSAMVMITIVTALLSPDPYGDSLRRGAPATASRQRATGTAGRTAVRLTRRCTSHERTRPPGVHLARRRRCVKHTHGLCSRPEGPDPARRLPDSPPEPAHGLADRQRPEQDQRQHEHHRDRPPVAQ